MSKLVIDLEDWEEIYEQTMKRVMNYQKCLLENINTAIKEKAHGTEENPCRIKRAIKFYPPNTRTIIGLLSRSDVKYRLDKKVNHVYMDNGKSDYIVMGLDLLINGIRVPEGNIIIETVDGNIKTMDKDLFEELYPNEPIE